MEEVFNENEEPKTEHAVDDVISVGQTSDQVKAELISKDNAPKADGEVSQINTDPSMD